MNEIPRITKKQLLTEINNAWEDLKKFVDTLSEDQLTAMTDPQGWSVKDHLYHLAVWERSINYFLQEQPRYAGLGIEKNLFERGDVDEMNKVIRNQHKKMSSESVIAFLGAVHSEFQVLIADMSEDNINQPLEAGHPETSEGGQYPVGKIIFDNTSDHFWEHLGWIKTLVMTKSN